MNSYENRIAQLKEEQHRTLSRISHEIRNPVTLINSFLQLLADKHPEVTGYEYWDEITDNMEYLLALLQELSAYNNSGHLNRQAVYMDVFLEKLAASVRPVLQYLQIQFDCRLRQPLPVLYIDEVKLRQALLNLIRNAEEAIQPPGKICLSALAEEDGLCISVSDTGSGIPGEYLDTLFEPFVTHKTSGTGLGLSIVRTIAEAHGGTVSVQSGPEGTVFTIRLPYMDSAGPAGGSFPSV